jgi:hypothetical protein
MGVETVKGKASAVLAFCIAAAGIAWAQETTGTFLGTIHDPSGAPIARAKVTATEAGTRRVHTTVCDDTGNYSLALLPVGTYELAAEAAGFKRGVQQDVMLHLGENLKVSFTLELGAVTESVEVSATYTRINTENASMSATVGSRDMQGIPVNGRNFNEFLGMLPGTVSTIPNEPNPLAFNRAGASMSGTRPGHNNWSQDGIFNMDIGAGGNFNDSVPIETIAELRVVSTNYDAQYGVEGGAQVDVVTKSGTKQFHGHMEEFFRNDKMDTRNFFSQTVPPLRFNSPGFSVGGPLYIPKVYNRERNKTFFFGAMEWQRISRGSTTTATIPTPAMRSGNFGGLKALKDPDNNGAPFPGNIIPAAHIDPNGAAYAALYPLPTLPGNAVNFVANPWSASNLRQELIRVDHQLTGKNLLTFRGSHNYYEYIQPGNALGYDTSFRHSTLYTYGVTVNSTLSPTLQNEFLFGETYGTLPTGARRTYNPQQLGINIPLLFPNDPKDYPAGVLDVSGIREHPPSVSPTGYTALTFANDTNSPLSVWQWKDNMSKVVGKHLLKAGFLVHREWKTQGADYNILGSAAMNGSYTGDGFADLLLGRAFTFSEVDKVQMPNVVRHTFEAYVDDHWKISPHFSLDVGVRLTYFGIPTEEAGNFRAFIPSLYNPAQAPVVLSSDVLAAGTGNLLNGLANPTTYQHDHQKGLAPRVGFAWDPPGKSKFVVRGGYGQFYNRESFDAIGFRQMASNPPFAQEVTVNQALLSNPGGGTVLTHPPSLNTANLKVLPQYYQEWNLSLQKSVFGSAVWDVSYVGNKGTHLARIDNINQPAPNVAVASGKVNVDTVRPYLGYGAITYADLTGRSIYNGLQTSLSQNFHRGLTMQVSYTFSKVLTDSGTSVYAGARRQEWAPADFSVTHNFVTTVAYQLPFFQSRPGLARKVLGNWQASGIYVLQSGKPTDVTIKSDIAGLGTTTQRPQITCNPNLPGGRKTPVEYFDTGCYTTPALGTLATTSVRSVRSPGVSNFNFSLLKRVRITESKSLELQGDLYNALNHTQFTSVGTTFGTTTFGVVTAAAASRETQLGLKFRW